MSVKTKRALFALAVVTVLGGCEIVAGIEDLQISGPADDAGSGDAGNPDADATTEASGSSSVPSIDASDAPVAADVGDSPSPGDATDASTDGAASDATPDADASDAYASDAYATDAPADAGGFADGAGLDAPADGPQDATGAGLVLIDDMQAVGVPAYGYLDGPGLTGGWFDFDDGTAGGVLVPAAGSVSAMIISLIPGTSAHAAHITGNSGFTVYGAGMGFSLSVLGTTPHPYDASAYQGFTFSARALGDAATTIVRFNVPDKNTTLVSGGGVCDGGTCNAYYGMNLTLTNAWQTFTVTYADLERPSYALSDGLPFDPSNLMGCQFQVDQGVAFDLWVDDIYFVDK